MSIMDLQLPIEQFSTGGAISGPATAAAAGTGLSDSMFGFGAVSSAFGSIASAYAQANSYAIQSSFQQQMARLNEKFATFSADDALRRGEKAVNDKRLETRQFIGAQRASLAAQGIEVNDGSALALQEDSAYFGQLEAITLKANAFREAFGYKVQALKSSSQGQFAGIANEGVSEQTLLTGGLKAAGTGLSAASYFEKR